MKKTTLLITTTAWLAVSSLLSASPLIIGHRGASFVAPENTVAAFNEAWKEKADGTELDVYLTKDGRIVAMHDKTTKKTTGHDQEVEEQTLEELKKLDAGSWKGEQWKGEPIPTLEESLAAIPNGKIVYIELKSDAKILPELKRVLDASEKPREDIVIIDFKYESLVQVRSLMPDLQTLWVVGGKRDPETKEMTYPDINDLATKAVEAGFNGLNLHYGFPLDAEVIKSVQDKGLSMAAWTVNEPEDAIRLSQAGLDAITTDKPLVIRQALEEAAK